MLKFEKLKMLQNFRRIRRKSCLKISLLLYHVSKDFTRADLLIHKNKGHRPAENSWPFLAAFSWRAGSHRSGVVLRVRQWGPGRSTWARTPRSSGEDWRSHLWMATASTSSHSKCQESTKSQSRRINLYDRRTQRWFQVRSFEVLMPW